VDTPEDIAVALNNADIKTVDAIMYSHWNPDHTMGMRIMEQLRLEWLDYYDGIKPGNPITVYADAGVLEDINCIRNKFGPFLDFYEQKMGLINRRVFDKPLMINGIRITSVPIETNQSVSVFCL